MRGGYRKRWIARHEASVWCPGGRWGPRRTRDTECWALIRAEDVYTGLLRQDAKRVVPGASGTAAYRVEGRELVAGWEVRENAVWKRGRVFLRCPRCAKRCTRLYQPLENSWLACRGCWGLTYPSRALQNYKDSFWGGRRFAWMLGTTHRDWALLATEENRRKRQAASRLRWAERRALLRPPPFRP
jgi:hypothetical protein